jgi:hypothetical protein
VASKWRARRIISTLGVVPSARSSVPSPPTPQKRGGLVPRPVVSIMVRTQDAMDGFVGDTQSVMIMKLVICGTQDEMDGFVGDNQSVMIMKLVICGSAAAASPWCRGRW